MELSESVTVDRSSVNRQICSAGKADMTLTRRIR